MASMESFADVRAALIYEHAEISVVNGYRTLAQSTFDLAKESFGRRILELGCGTGISTAVLTTSSPQGTTVDAIDRSPGFLETARYKFGQHDSPGEFAQMVRGTVLPPGEPLGLSPSERLTEHLKNERLRLEGFASRVRFIQGEVVDTVKKIR